MRTRVSFAAALLAAGIYKYVQGKNAVAYSTLRGISCQEGISCKGKYFEHAMLQYSMSTQGNIDGVWGGHVPPVVNIAESRYDEGCSLASTRRRMCSTVEETLSPMLREYRQTQAQHPGAVVLWRNGEFFEVYFETARLLGTELNLRVKPRPFGKEVVDFTGVPIANGANAARRLLQRGYRVVVVEQTDEPAPPGRGQKKPISRAVARVLTPGTLVELDLLDGRSNNYLASVIVDDGMIGLAYCDVSTGEFVATEFSGKRAFLQLEGELMRLLPSEILLSDDEAERPPTLQPQRSNDAEQAEAGSSWTRGHITTWPAWHWDQQTAAEALTRQLDVVSLAGFGLANRPFATRAAGAIVQYLQETHRAAVAQIDHIRIAGPDGTMLLDSQTQRNLELLAPMGARTRGALIDLLDQTLTPMGARLLRQWLAQPLTDLGPLQRRQDAISHYVEDTKGRAEVRTVLKDIGDIERITNRAIQGLAGFDDLRRLRDSLRGVPLLASFIPDDSAVATIARGESTAGAWTHDDVTVALDLLERALVDDDGEEDGADHGAPRKIRPGFDPLIDEVTQNVRETMAWMETFEIAERERTGIRSLRLISRGKIGWFIEVGKSGVQHLPPTYQRKSGPSEDRWTTPELQSHEFALEQGRQRLLELERTTLARLVTDIAHEGPQLLMTARAIASIDVCATLAEVAVRRQYVRPILTEGTELHIIEGRHPIVEANLSERFVANATMMDTVESQILLVTGPNMAGKSTFLRQVALIVLLAQIGSFVPAQSAHIGLVDRIFTRIGAQDDIATGQSTFLVEMNETSNILHSATNRSLIVLDELGRGTSTYDGMSIARAVIECIHSSPRLGCRTLFATHYHELTELAGILPRVQNYHVTVAEHQDQIIFLHKVLPGKADRSYGIHVARMAGMPPSVVRRAQTILEQFEEESHTLQTRSNGRTESKVVHEDATKTAAQHSHLRLLAQHIQALEVDDLTPLEALNQLYALRTMAAEIPE